MSNLSPAKLAEIAAVADVIRAHLGTDADADADALLDTLDGETDALDMLDALLAADVEARAMQAAVKAQADALRDRASAFAKRSEAIRSGLGKLLDAIGERKVTRPLATGSRTAPRQSVEVHDPDIERKPLVKEIGDALKAGETIPGAEMKEGRPGLMVRT